MRFEQFEVIEGGKGKDETLDAVWDESGFQTLSQGDRGDLVIELQRALAFWGFNPGPADGDYGPNTAEAVAAMQRWLKVDDDGAFGPETANQVRMQLTALNVRAADFASGTLQPEPVAAPPRQTALAPRRAAPAAQQTIALPSAGGVSPIVIVGALVLLGAAIFLLTGKKGKQARFENIDLDDIDGTDGEVTVEAGAEG